MSRVAFGFTFSVVGILFTLPGSISAEENPRLRDVIDQHVQAVWQREKITPAAPADDAAFLRRVYLDLCGVIPTHDETIAFLGDADGDRRTKLLDRLLADPRFARHQADVWDLAMFTRNPPGYDTHRRDGFQKWLAAQFEQNTPYDEWVRKILKAEGNTVEEGAPMFMVMYRSQPEDANEAISQLFLGVQLQCARCHDHPYEKWTQLDFYGMAAFFARLQVVSLGNKDGLTKFAVGEKSTGDILFTGPASQQQAGKKGDPVKPKFLHSDPLAEPALPEGFKEEKLTDNKAPTKPPFSRKDQLADWITRPDNPYFARAVANRVWSQYMGRGLVHPIDNMSPSNVPSHPELLDALAAAMRQGRGSRDEGPVTEQAAFEVAVAEIPDSNSGPQPSTLDPRPFNLKWFIRELVLSKTYQLSSDGPTADALPQWFEQAKVRPLSAEELADSWRIATGFEAWEKLQPKKPGEGRFHPLTRDYVVKFFGTPNSGAGDFQGGLHEHLYLNNGQLGSLFATGDGTLLNAMTKTDAPWEARVDRLFLTVLNRRPLDEERAKFVAAITSEKQPEERLRDAIWALLTCSEFRFVH